MLARFQHIDLPMTADMTTRKQRIDDKLAKTLSIQYVDIENESHRHHVPKDSETHFKVTVVSENFQSLRLIQRHQLINQALKEELATGLHALSIHAYTPNEWLNRQMNSRQSPNCRDGFKK